MKTSNKLVINITILVLCSGSAFCKMIFSCHCYYIYIFLKFTVKLSHSVLILNVGTSPTFGRFLEFREIERFGVSLTLSLLRHINVRARFQRIIVSCLSTHCQRLILCRATMFLVQFPSACYFV